MFHIYNYHLNICYQYINLYTYVSYRAVKHGELFTYDKRHFAMRRDVYDMLSKIHYVIPLIPSNVIVHIPMQIPMQIPMYSSMHRAMYSSMYRAMQTQLCSIYNLF